MSVVIVLFILTTTHAATFEQVGYTMASPTCGDSPNINTAYHGDYIEDTFSPYWGYHAFMIEFILTESSDELICNYLVESDWQTEDVFIQDYMTDGLEDFEYVIIEDNGIVKLDMYVPLSLYNEWMYAYGFNTPEIFLDGIWVKVSTEPVPTMDTGDTADTAETGTDTGSKTAGGGGVSCRGCQDTFGFPLGGLVWLLPLWRRPESVREVERNGL